jgi:hypothetical protein
MRSLDDLAVQERVLMREVATGSDHDERLGRSVPGGPRSRNRLEDPHAPDGRGSGSL